MSVTTQALRLDRRELAALFTYRPVMERDRSTAERPGVEKFEEVQAHILEVVRPIPDGKRIYHQA